ncbi:hypothetical protein GCM10022226_06630 [Sphaerisporangium flaviroseum]|uniref:Uncharacterized protein n=1 Tax=Sphaerisporangium flaviroseum TaxID=509199 RepID=A0ABP7HH44_9ACTN
MRKSIVISLATLALAVAASPVQAARSSAEPTQGTYWRVRTVLTMTHPHQVGTGSNKYWLVERRVIENWAGRDGKHSWGFRPLGAQPKSTADRAAWKRDGSPQKWSYRTEGMKVDLSMAPEKGTIKPVKGTGWRIEGRKLSFQDLQAMPTDPAALKEWLVKAASEGENPVQPQNMDRWLKGAYASLLYEFPVSKAVRQAAYDALSAMPGVQHSNSGSEDTHLWPSGIQGREQVHDRGRHQNHDGGVLHHRRHAQRQALPRQEPDQGHRSSLDRRPARRPQTVT